MFLKKLPYLIVVFSVCFGAESIKKPKTYIIENIKLLNKLVKKKKSAKSVLSLDLLFDDYAEDAKKLLEDMDQQTAENKSVELAESVKQIAHNMAVLQKLLNIMNSGQPEPLKLYCQQRSGDALWGSLCGDRPAKRILKQEEPFKKVEQKPKHTNIHSNIHYVEPDDEELKQASY